MWHRREIGGWLRSTPAISYETLLMEDSSVEYLYLYIVYHIF
jgi:hypothetical protein